MRDLITFDVGLGTLESKANIKAELWGQRSNYSLENTPALTGCLLTQDEVSLRVKMP